MNIQDLNSMAKSLHKIAAEYYLGIWSDKKKPFTYTENQMKMFGLKTNQGEEDRKVPKQPLFFGNETEKRYNLKKLSSLPYHLAVIGDVNGLQSLLCNFSFLLTKMMAFSVNEVLFDFEFAEKFVSDPQLNIVGTSLRSVASTLVRDVRNIAPEIVGMLYNYSHKSEFPNLKKLIEDAISFGQKALPMMPVFPCFLPPGGILQATLEGHEEEICSIQISPNGKYIVSGSKDRQIKVWNLDSGTLSHTISNLPDVPQGLCITNDSKLLISYYFTYEYCDSHEINVWLLESGELLKTMTGHEEGKCKGVITPDDQYFIAGDDTFVKIWSIEKGEVVQTLEGHEGEVVTLEISKDGKTLLSGSRDHFVIEWDLKTFEQILKFEEPNGGCPVASIAYSPDEKLIAMESLRLGIYEASTGNHIRSFEDPEVSSSIVSIKMTKDGEYIISGDCAGSVKLFKIDTGDLIYRIDSSPDDNILFLELIDEDLLFFATKRERSPRFVDLKSGKVLENPKAHEGEITCGIYSNVNGQNICVTAATDKNLKVWNLKSLDKTKLIECKGHKVRLFENGVRINEDDNENDDDDDENKEDEKDEVDDSSSPDLPIQHHEGYISKMQLIQNEKYLLTCSREPKLKLWDTSTGKCVKTYKFKSLGGIGTFSVGSDNKTIAIGAGNMVWYIVDLETMNEVKFTTGGDSFAVSSYRFTSDLQYIICSTSSSNIVFWKISNSSKYVFKSKFSANIVVPLKNDIFLFYFRSQFYDKSGSTKVLRVYFYKEDKFFDLIGHEDRITCVVGSSSGKYALSGGDDNVVYIWDLHSVSCNMKLVGHTKSVLAVDINQNETMVITSSSDKSIIIWDFKTGKKIHTISNLLNDFNQLYFTSCSTYFFALSENVNYFSVWDSKTFNHVSDFHFHTPFTRIIVGEEKNRIILGTTDGRIITLQVNQLIENFQLNQSIDVSNVQLKVQSKEQQSKEQQPKQQQQQSSQSSQSQSQSQNNQSRNQNQPNQEQEGQETIEGYLLKKGGFMGSQYQRRHFTLQNNLLQWGISKGDLKNQLDISQVSSIQKLSRNESGKDYCFRLNSSSKSYVLVVSFFFFFFFNFFFK